MTGERLQTADYVKRGVAGAALLLSAVGCSGNPFDKDSATSITTTTIAPEGPGTTLANTPTTTLAPGELPTEATTTTISRECQFNHNEADARIRFDGDHVQMSAFYGNEIRVGDHSDEGECFERVVIEMNLPDGVSNMLPGVEVRYVDQVIGDPSGEPVQVAGNAYLQMTLGSWMYGPSGGDGPMRITGEQLASREMDNIQEIVVTQNFEGMSTIVIGLDERAAFAVNELSGTANCPDLCVYVDIHDEN